MGTPTYMSPEQMRASRSVDHRSDIWSLGVVLYELVQGAPPFAHDAFSAMVLKVVNDPLPKLTVKCPDGLDAVIYRCLEKDANRRFQNLSELTRALAKYAQSPTQAIISVQRTSGIIGAKRAWPRADAHRVTPAPASTISASVSARTVRQRGGRRWSRIAATCVVICVVAIVTVRSSRDVADTALPGVPRDRALSADAKHGSATSAPSAIPATVVPTAPNTRPTIDPAQPPPPSPPNANPTPIPSTPEPVPAPEATPRRERPPSPERPRHTPVDAAPSFTAAVAAAGGAAASKRPATRDDIPASSQSAPRDPPPRPTPRVPRDAPPKPTPYAPRDAPPAPTPSAPPAPSSSEARDSEAARRQPGVGSSPRASKATGASESPPPANTAALKQQY